MNAAGRSESNDGSKSLLYYFMIAQNTLIDLGTAIGGVFGPLESHEAFWSVKRPPKV